MPWLVKKKIKNMMRLSSSWFLHFAQILWPSCFVAVDDSAILDCHFSDFYHTAPQGFEKILFEQQIFWAHLSWCLHLPYIIYDTTVWQWLDFLNKCGLMPFFVSYDYFVLSLLLWIEARVSAGLKIADRQNYISPCRDTFSCQCLCV